MTDPSEKKRKIEFLFGPTSSTPSNFFSDSKRTRKSSGDSAMATNLVLGIWTQNSFRKIKMENVDLEKNVEEFKLEACKQLESNNIELCYCGMILDDKNSLASYGVTSGGIIHVLEKKPEAKPEEKAQILESDLQSIFSVFRRFNDSSSYRNTLQKLLTLETIDTMIAETPGLEEDPVAIAILQDPELLIRFTDPEAVRKAVEKHPILISAFKNLMQKMKMDVSGLSQPTTSTGYSYSLEALSDDDEMESNGDSSLGSQPLSRNASYNAITTAQLAAAIANATNTAFNMTSAGIPTSGGSGSGGVITNEMFSDAIQQAFSSVPFGQVSGSGSGTRINEEESLETITRRLQPQLQQMHEMGLLNDSINIRALQATSGDVQAAIELVFNGVVD